MFIQYYSKCEQVGLLHPKTIGDECTRLFISCNYCVEAAEKAACLKVFACCVEASKYILVVGCVNNLLRHLLNDRDGEFSLLDSQSVSRGSHCLCRGRISNSITASN